ncbi:polycomb protein Sfmbt-like isoform X2 [Arctopsyche grandis]|uniref:polycomb protein Sfmbt-like isoform X2 n=1 Tax=Arctopsyche grandis TaxID=121162 RepID=UPI00406D6D64
MNNTSNYPNPNKKIKPIEHPELVLKSPIAYHGGTDLSVIPIDKDGIAVCEKCGAIGVKHAFYTKQRKFCSLTCARSYTGLTNPQKDAGISMDENLDSNMEDNNQMNNYKKQANYRFKLMESTDHLVGMIPMEPLPQLPGMWQAAIDDFMQPIPHKTGNLFNTYEWKNELFSCDFTAAPVKLFAHAPLSDMWNNVFEGMKVEVKNTDCENFSYKLSNYFWVATVLKLKGYMGLLRYEGFGNDESKDFWLNLMHSEVHPVGWCATRGKPLIPPQSIENKYSDWKSFLVQQLTGARTLPTDFYNKVNESMKSRFRIGHVLEVVDKNRICQVKVATVHEIVGKRLHIRYYNSTPEDNGFWCHEDCPLIHPVGWAREVGHLLDAPPEYLERLNNDSLDSDDATNDLFKYYIKKDPHNINFESNFTEGMKLEAIDPLNLSSICVATVMKVLLHGYIMIRIDCYPPDESGSDWFCYHEFSPYIFPAGFCSARGIPMTVATGQAPLPKSSLNVCETTSQHGFSPGMRLECADLMDPRLVCVATIAGIVGRLLKVHFNGWGDEYDQWLDCESTDIYPVGWCQAVSHKLEGPFVPARQPVGNTRKKGRKKKNHKMSNDQQKTTQNGSGNMRRMKPLYDTLDMGNSNDDGLFDLLESKSEIDFNMDMQNMNNKLESHNINNLESILDDKLTSESAPSNDQLDFDMNIDVKSNFLPSDCMNRDDSNMDIDQIDIKEENIRELKSIPRLVGNITSMDLKTMETVDPESWDTEDVAQFLTINDCAPYCMNFSQITGKMMLELTKDEIIELLQMKVGPSLKIYDLIQQLKCKLKPVHARSKAFK